MNVWQRSWVYRLYVVGGIAGIVVHGVVSGMNAAPGDDSSLKTSVAFVAIWVVGLLALQGIQLFADRPDDDASVAGRSWSFARTGFVLVAALGLLTAAGGLLHVNGVDAAIGPFWEGGPSLPLVFAPVVVLTLAWGVRVPAMLAKAVDLGNEHLQGLGLEIRSIPESRVLPTASGGLRHHLTGDTVLGGRRHGREVTVELGTRGSVVHVACSTEPFETAGDGVRFTGGPDGIVAERRGGAGTEAWQADLFEAERLAGAATGPSRELSAAAR